MPSKLSKIRKYFRLVERVQLGDYPSKGTLMELFEDDDISPRSFDRYRKDLEDEFGVILKYHKADDGYSLEFEDEIDKNKFFYFFELAMKTDVLYDLISEDRKALEILDFERIGEFAGMDWIQPIFKAIKNKKIIAFKHKRFTAEFYKDYSIYPYKLREYQGRWYVIGYDIQARMVKNFGLSRIDNLTVSNQPFVEKPDYDVLEKYDHIIGVSNQDKRIEKVVLRLTDFQANYLRTLPLHPTQVELDTAPDGFVDLQYKLVVNYELVQRIWMLGKEIEVMAPDSLVYWVKNKEEKPN